MKESRFCKRGHDTHVTGRLKPYGCRECQRIRNNSPEGLARTKAWMRSPEGIKSQHANRLKRNFGLTPEQYAGLFKEQSGRCAICSKPQKKFKMKFGVDHDHSCCSGIKSCGECIRGLLCSTCNTRLSALEDTQFKQQAESYLSKWHIGNSQRR